MLADNLKAEIKSALTSYAIAKGKSLKTVSEYTRGACVVLQDLESIAELSADDLSEILKEWLSVEANKELQLKHKGIYSAGINALKKSIIEGVN
jgi:hypothetical protein|tara:strand:+ start:237 stop:518 length:282 start_codon:yes stop_codon:yes gene_type:complete